MPFQPIAFDEKKPPTIEEALPWAEIQVLLNRIENVTTEGERVALAGKSNKQEYTATLLLVRTVEVQVT